MKKWTIEEVRVFTGRQHSLIAMQSPVLATVGMSVRVRLSVRLSHAGTQSKRKLGS